MEAHLLGDEIDTVSSHHVEGGVGDVYDAGDTKDKGKPNGKKGEYTPADKSAYDNVEDKIHWPSNSNHQIPITKKFSFSRNLVIIWLLPAPHRSGAGSLP
jgi:hypothetical protein